MKRVIALGFIIVLMAMPLMAVQAQGDGEFADVSQIFVQQAESGSFVDNGDDTYMLTLVLDAENTTYVQSEPTMSSGVLPNGVLATGWASAEDLVATQTILLLSDMSVSLTLSLPEYNAETGELVYMATVEEIMAGDDTNAKGLEVPETFETASLYIFVDTEFSQGFQVGLEASGLRQVPD